MRVIRAFNKQEHETERFDVVNRNTVEVSRRSFAYTKNYKGRFTLSIVATFLGTIFTVIAPKLLGDVTTVLYADIVNRKWFLEDLPNGTVYPATVWVQGPFMPIGKAHAIMWLVIIRTQRKRCRTPSQKRSRLPATERWLNGKYTALYNSQFG